MKRPGVALAGQLRGAIYRHRPWCVAFADGNLGRRSVDFRAGHLNESFDARRAGLDQQLEGSAGVHLVILGRSVNGVANAETGEMKDRAHAGHEWPDVGRPVHIADHQSNLFERQALEIFRTAVDEIVEHHDTMTVCGQLRHELRSNKARASCDEDRFFKPWTRQCRILRASEEIRRAPPRLPRTAERRA